MAEIFVTVTHQDPASTENVGFRFRISYDGRQVNGTVEVPAGNNPTDTNAFREEFTRLAEEIGDAVKSPSGIITHLPGD